jgi:V/A-type H+-transporting ATPase subunit K
MKTLKRLGVALIIFNLLAFGFTIWAWAQAKEEPVTAVGGVTDKGLLAIGSGLAFLGGAIGTGLAQSRIIAAVLGAVAEDPGQLGFGIFLIAFPETLVILGLAMAFLIKFVIVG